MTIADDDSLLARALAATGDTDPQVERILDAALDQFKTFGLRKTTIDDVARHAKIGRATIYRRFPTKDDLIAGVVLRETQRFFADLDGAVSGLATMEERLVEGFVTALRINREYTLLNRLMALEPEVILPLSTQKIGPLLATVRGYLAHRFRTAQRKETLGDFDPEIVAELMIRLCHSLMLTPDGRIPLDEDGARDFARHYLLPIVTHRPGPAR